MTTSSSELASERGPAPEADAATATEGPAGTARLRTELNVFDAVAVVVGTVIGSGIFLLPSFVAAQLHSLGAVLLVWLAGGLLSAFGALSLAELGSIYPGTGGLCTYLRHIYGPLPAFLYAWALLLMIHSGSIAALAVAFGIFAGQVLPLNMVEQKVLSVGLILGLTLVSCLGIRGGKFVQNLIALAKVGGLVGVILLLTTKGSLPLRFFAGPASGQGPAFSIVGFGIALVAVLWAYEGWHVLSFIAGEMKRPKVDLPRSLLYGSAIVTLIYLVANLGYYHVLPAAEIQGSNAVAALAVGKLLGRSGANAISILIVVSILGSMNGLVLSGPRVSFAMAREGIFPAIFGRLSHRYRTPVVALAVQGVWSAMLAASGSYPQLFTDVIFTAWIFYGLAVAGVLVLRHSQPQLARPFSVPGYPWLSLLFCVAAAGLIISTVMARPMGAAIGLVLVATGIPVYFFAIKAGRQMVRRPARCTARTSLKNDK
jgi:APA family basic amino acid/polyamine antiporter